MKRIAGVASLLAVLFALLVWADPANATRWSNLKDVFGQQAFFGILTLGIGVVMITGGIDLSIGSVIGFSAVFFGYLMQNGVAPLPAVGITLLAGVIIGTLNALLITRLRLQPFLVTLCGLFVYRGLARMLSEKQIGVFSIIADAPEADRPLLRSQIAMLRQYLIGYDSTNELAFPSQVVVLAVLATIVAVVLHKSVLGRHWYALGHNEAAARFAGIRVERSKAAAYVLCSTFASLGGVLTILNYGGVNPVNVGDGWELYAITGAVLGGCSLRGGEGSVPGMILGAAVLPLLKNLINFVGSIPWVLERVKIDSAVPAIIGLTLLFGTIADEAFRKRLSK